jgi:hypothetical protein
VQQQQWGSGAVVAVRDAGVADMAGLIARISVEVNPSATGWLSVTVTSMNPAFSRPWR